MYRTVLATLITMFLLFSVAGTALAQPRTVGVNVGDWFKYGDVGAQWTSNYPNSTTPAIVNSFNSIALMEMTITAVSGTNISAQQMIYYKNGTETSSNGWVDINSGDAQSFDDFLISANLIPGETEYNSQNYVSLIINDTMKLSFLGVIRYVNHFNNTNSASSGSSVITQSADFLWDMDTGVALEVAHFLSNQTGPYTSTLSYHFRLTDSPVIPEFPVFTSTIIVLMLMTPAILVLSKRRQLRKSIH